MINHVPEGLRCKRLVIHSTTFHTQRNGYKGPETKSRTKVNPTCNGENIKQNQTNDTLKSENINYVSTHPLKRKAIGNFHVVHDRVLSSNISHNT